MLTQLSPWIGMLLVLTLLLVLIVLLKSLQARFAPHPEVTRKLLHTAMGLVTLSFPWLFARSWPVWTLAAVSSLLLLAIKWLPRLKRDYGGVVGAVDRQTLGDLYFPLAVAITFELAGGQAVLFVAPVAMLTFADAVAALIGLRYGTIRYQSGSAHKTLEGSVAFFVVAFFSVQLPLTLLTGLDTLPVLLISLLLAGVVMLAEGMASRGLDNLFIPVGGYFLLTIYLQTSAYQLGLRLLVLALLMAAVFFWRRNTRLDPGAAIGSVLLLFVTWSLRPWHWLLPPLLLLAVYSYYVLKDRQPAGMHSVDAILAVGLPALGWIALSLLLNKDYLFGYSLAYAAQLAITGIAHFHSLSVHDRNQSRFLLLLRASLPAFLLLMITLAAGFVGEQHWLLMSVTGLPLIFAAAWAFQCLQPGIEDCPVDGRRWLRQSAIASLASAPGPLLPLPVSG